LEQIYFAILFLNNFFSTLTLLNRLPHQLQNLLGHSKVGYEIHTDFSIIVHKFLNSISIFDPWVYPLIVPGEQYSNLIVDLQRVSQVNFLTSIRVTESRLSGVVRVKQMRKLVLDVSFEISHFGHFAVEI
jgi:hypothetical protein